MRTSPPVCLLCFLCLLGFIPSLPAQPAPTNQPPGRPPLMPVPTRGPRPQLPLAAPTNAPRPLAAPSIQPAPLTLNAETLELHAKPGQTNANFTFLVTNNAPIPLVIADVRTSCGCTIATAPARPWTLDPGAGGPIEVAMDLRGKRGALSKSVYLYVTDFAPRILTVKAHIPEPAEGFTGERGRNVQIATADRQAVFRGDCARCHATPTVGKSGQELYAAACGICHDAEHRASMVPDLRTLPHTTSRDHWRIWVTHGKPGTLMPAFSQSQGGPLSPTQIDSLVDYLIQAFPSRPGLPPAAPAPAPKLFPPID